jgi:hypothetical protein
VLVGWQEVDKVLDIALHQRAMVVGLVGLPILVVEEGAILAVVEDSERSIPEDMQDMQADDHIHGQAEVNVREHILSEEDSVQIQNCSSASC